MSQALVRDIGSGGAFAGHPYASLFTSPPWAEALTQSYGLDVQVAKAGPNGSAGGLVPFCHVDDIRGERVVVLPFSDYCDPLVADLESWRQVSRPLFERRVPLLLRCLRNGVPEQDPRLKVVRRAFWHAVDLTRPEEAIWAALDGQARQNVRRAQRSGVVVREGRALEDIYAFHRMHCHVRKAKYRMLAQPLAFFEQLHACFAPDERITVLLAEVEGEPIAGIVFLEWGDSLYYKFNAAVDLQHRPNDLLVWEGIRLGRRRGLVQLDFGTSDLDQRGLVRYKQKFASEMGEIRTLRWQPPGYADRRGDEAGRALGRMTQLLTDPGVPDEITRAAGDDLYRYFC